MDIMGIVVVSIIIFTSLAIMAYVINDVIESYKLLKKETSKKRKIKKRYW